MQAGRMPNFRGFPPEGLAFFAALAANNTRDHWLANKETFERTVRDPLRAFLDDVADEFGTFHLFRMNRDVRFAKDKSPYKTFTGIQFRHELGRDVHAPGFYLHLEPGQVFAGAGVWHPDAEALGRIRDAIVADPDRWTKVVRERRFAELFRLEGDALKRPPAGYDSAHPAIDDLKRKDFIAVAPMADRRATSAGLDDELAGMWLTAAPFVHFLCDAVGVPF